MREPRSAGAGAALDPVLDQRTQAARQTIKRLAKEGVPDAQAIVGRTQGDNNLQGHAQALVALAVWFLRHHPEELPNLTQRSQLHQEMGRGSPETRDSGLWDPIADKLRALLASHGDEFVFERLKDGAAQTAREAAQYLPVRFGGAQESGGGGATVFKRACKLLAHMGGP